VIDVFEHILVPVDFTDKSAKTLDVAIKMADLYRARLTLLHVIETLEYEDSELHAFYASLESAAWSKLKPMAEQCANTGIQVDQDVIFGRRAVSIVDYASDAKADLLILGSHRIASDNPPKNLLTLSYQVALMCQCPVLLVK
jgi:nucleotide-binding universal stress UspA family protein